MAIRFGTPAVAGPGGGGSVAPLIEGDGGDALGATSSLALSAAQETWKLGTLTDDLDLTVTNLVAGARGVLLFTQDATGGRSLTINGVAVTIPTDALSPVEVTLKCDGTDEFVTAPGMPGEAGAPGTTSDASTTVKGIVKLATAPVSPTEPIAVGDNDPRLDAAADLAAHLADGADAHDATAVSFAAGGAIAATNVQAAIEEVAGELATAITDHLGDGTDAHDASAVSFAPGGTVAATNVQAAIEEVAAETHFAFAEVAASESTASTSATDLATVGPSVQVVVPASGIVQIYAEVEIQGDGTNNARVHLQDDTDFNTAGTSQTILQRATASFTVMRTSPASNSGASTRISGVLTFLATPGTRTYTLKYSVAAGAGGSFRNRKIWGRAA